MNERRTSDTGRLIRLGLHEVSKRFRGIAALTDVTLDARAGEILGFIGPNGAGKTTLFDVISGFTRPDRGRILLGEGTDAVDVGRTHAAALVLEGPPLMVDLQAVEHGRRLDERSARRPRPKGLVMLFTSLRPTRL